MAKRHTEKDATTQDTESVTRRSYLQLAGAAVGTLAMAGATSGSADAASYDTVTVSAGSTHQISLGSGDTLENTIIDITASGANVNIRANGRNWTLRNVAIVGSTPAKPAASSPMMVCYDTGGDSLIENCWFGDGSGGGSWREAIAGVFVHARHAGTLTIRDCYFQGWLNNAIYASPPGNPDTSYYQPNNVGQGGHVYVENSYFENNDVASIRLGSEGSYARDCVVNGGSHRGCWAYFEHIDFINVDATASRAFEAGGGSHDYMSSAVAALDNCRADGDVRARSGAEVDGEAGSNPDTTPPDGVPLSPEEAASGTVSDTPDDGDQETDEPAGTLLELVAGDDTTNVSYEFTVEGSVTERVSGSGPVAEANDTVTDNGDGTVTVTGVSGNGYGDAFFVDGTITSMDLDESAWTIRYDGTEVSVADLTPDDKLPNTLVIDGSDSPGKLSTYQFTVSGEAAKDPEIGTPNDFDTVSDGEISGRIVGGKDGFRYSGEITSFSIDGPATVQLGYTE